MKADEAGEMMDAEKSNDKFKTRTAIMIAVLAMLLAVTGLGGQNAAKEATNNNIFASNLYAFYQAKNIRQTSFALVEVMPEIDAPDEVKIDEKDLKIDVYRSGGHGGQSVNTTDSAVRVTHVPTGTVVAIQNERSQIQNKETALKILRGRLAQMQAEQHAETLADLRAGESASWGNQIRNYVLHPYTLVKDTRTKHETNNAQGVLDGDLDPFMEAFLEAPEAL